MKPMIRTILAALALALATPAAAQNWTQTTPISNGVLRTGFNAAGYQISNLGNVTFVSEEALDALREQLGIANLTISQLNDPLAENAWALRASDGSFQINGGERRVEFRRELGLEEDGPSSRADGGGPVFSARYLTDVSFSFPETSHPERMWFNNGVVEFDSPATRDAFRESLAIPASNNATALTTGTLAAGRLPTITLNTSGVLHASPITLTAGVGNMTLQPQAANTVFAGPASGNATAPTFRALTSADLPRDATLSGNVAVAGPTLTGNASGPPALAITQTWDTTGLPTALVLNVTESQSANAAAALLDLQRGGFSQARITRSGLMTLATGVTVTGTVQGFRSDGGSLFWQGLQIQAGRSLSWGPLGSGTTLEVYSDASDRMTQRRGTNPQTFQVANAWFNTSNNERLDIGWSGNVASIGPAAAGNGTLRPLTLTGSTVTVPGNTVLGDAAADAVTVNAATLTAPNASGATADALMTRALMPLESILGMSRMPVPLTAASVVGEANATFTAPSLQGTGVRFNNGSGSTAGSWSGATVGAVASAPANILPFTARFALEFTYAQGSNAPEVVFVVLLGSNNRRDLTGRGIGMEIACGNGTVTLKAHDGSAQTAATTAAESANIFYRRYVLVWDGVRTLTLYRANVSAPYARPEIVGSVQIPANATGNLSNGELRFGFFATATVPFNQDSYVKNVWFHRF